MKQIFKSENQKPDLNFRFAAKFEEKQILRSENIVTHTQNHANEVSGMLNLDPTLFKLIPHGISSNLRTEFKERNMHHVSKVRILFVGRLEHRKGFDVFVRAIPTILESFPDIHIDICGTGEMLEKAKADYALIYKSNGRKIESHWLKKFQIVAEFDWNEQKEISNDPFVWRNNNGPPKWILLRIQ